MQNPFHLFSLPQLLMNIWFVSKIITGLQNFDKDNIVSVVTAAEKVPYFTLSTLFWWLVLEYLWIANEYVPSSLCLQGGATHVDIACDPELVKLAISLTSCPVYLC